jgi:hypothetical protein
MSWAGGHWPGRTGCFPSSPRSLPARRSPTWPGGYVCLLAADPALPGRYWPGNCASPEGHSGLAVGPRPVSAAK